VIELANQTFDGLYAKQNPKCIKCGIVLVHGYKVMVNQEEKLICRKCKRKADEIMREALNDLAGFEMGVLTPNENRV